MQIKKSYKLTKTFLPLLGIWVLISAISVVTSLVPYFVADPLIAELWFGIWSFSTLGVLGGLLVLGILFFVWLVRVTKNAKVLAKSEEERKSFYPAWNVIAFLIPIISWIAPYFNVKKIWEQSAPKSGDGQEKQMSLLITWWILWVASDVISSVEDVFVLTSGREMDPLLSSLLFSVSGVIAIASAPFFYKVISLISRQQDAKLDKVSS